MGHGSFKPAASNVEGGVKNVEGDREAVELGVYYNRNTLNTLREFIEHLKDEKEIRHYNKVATELSHCLNIEDEEIREAYVGASAYIEQIGSAEIEQEVKGLYQDQLKKSLQIIDGYMESISLENLSEAERNLRLEQEKAVLIYAEFLLAQIRLQSANEEIKKQGESFNLADALNGLHINDTQKTALAQAFHQMANFAEFSYLQSCSKLTTASVNYVTPEQSSTRTSGTVRLDEEFVGTYLERVNAQIEGAHRLVIDALDRLNKPARQRWVDQREQNPAINLNENPFTTWQTQVEDRISKAEGARRPLESKDYINGILGTGKEETKFFLVKGNHELKHHIKNVVHKAPVREVGSPRDELADVMDTQIAIKAGIWQGEWNSGSTAKPGESHPREFYDRVVDITVWSVTLNSADKVENFLDQLGAADAVQMDGEVVERVLGNQAEVPDAQAFRIPVLNHLGQPSFLVVNSKTYNEMKRAALTSRESYAALLARDTVTVDGFPRYGVHKRETHYTAFKPQLREYKTQEGWVDQERDFLLVQKILEGRLETLRAGGEVDRYVADQIEDAMMKYHAQFNEFQMNYCRTSRYRAIARARLVQRGIDESAPDYQDRLLKEMNAVALEYVNRWNAFRSITSRLLEMQNIHDAEQEFLTLLANIDYELEIQIRADSTSFTAEEIKATLQPFMRMVEPTTVDGHLLPKIYYINVESLKAKDSSVQALLKLPDALTQLVSEESPLSQIAKESQEAITSIAGTSNDNLYWGDRFSSIEARTILENLQALRVRNPNVLRGDSQVSEIDLFNDRVNALMSVLVSTLAETAEGGDLVYPDNRTSAEAVAAMNAQSIRLDELLGRKPDSAEENRFLDGQQDVIAERIRVIETLAGAGELWDGLSELSGYLSRTLGDRDLIKLSKDELVDYACMVYAAISTVAQVKEGDAVENPVASFDRYLLEATGTLVTSSATRQRLIRRTEELGHPIVQS